MSASETWWLVALIVAGVAALLHLASAVPARRTTTSTGEVHVAPGPPLAALARALTAAAVGLTALGFLVLPG